MKLHSAITATARGILMDPQPRAQVIPTRAAAALGRGLMVALDCARAVHRQNVHLIRPLKRP